MGRGHSWGALFPDSAFLVGGLAVMSLIQLLHWPISDGLAVYLTPAAQAGLFACFLVGSVISLTGLAVTHRDALVGGWIQAGGLLGIEFGFGVYTYLFAAHADGWWLTPTAWLLFGLMAMFASRCIRVVLFTVGVFRQASREVKQDRRRP
jgi:MFS superfamily sulfate permease-like transporter